MDFFAYYVNYQAYSAFVTGRWDTCARILLSDEEFASDGPAKALLVFMKNTCAEHLENLGVQGADAPSTIINGVPIPVQIDPSIFDGYHYSI